MKNPFLLLFLLSSALTFGHAPNWGKTGHRATAEIASDYLTKKAKKKIRDLLDGKSPALVSTFGDDIKSDSSYDKYKVWHYLDIPEGKTYEDIKDEDGENIIIALKKIKAGLKDADTPRDKKKFYLKMLIHLIGDLHQPLHIGHPKDLGGNKIIVFWFKDSSNLHRVWDTNMLNSYKMSYTELAENQAELDKSEIKDIQEGAPVDWLKDTHKITNKVYNSAENGDYLSYDYMYNWIPVMREQLQKGGIRLAKELNDIFG